ncbi:MAG: hypothetical protein NT039_02705 [Candidatus Berkelbacteria bacterium]|nr:hypothetical protein [Candidatus Berkelbacteria bacterium]
MKYKSWLIVLVAFFFYGFFLGVPAPIKANGTSFYDLNSTDSNAYQMVGSFGVPPPTSVSWTAYTGAQLTNARHLDALRNSWAAPANSYYYLLYRFKINENISDITKIDFDWIGYDNLEGGKCLTRLIWNKNTPAWESLGTDCVAQSSDQEYIDSINSNLEDYIDSSGYIYFGITGGYVSGSCPYIYSYDGQNYTLEDEAYSFAILKPWQYESFSLLENLKPVNGKYRLKLTEELSEVSKTNRLKLWVVDHPQGSEILPDFAGNLYTISAPISPNKAVDFKGKDQSQKISKKDDQFWESNLNEQDLTKISDLYNGLVLTFPIEGKPENAKLILKAKESDFLSKSWSKFLSLIGNNNTQFLESLQNDPEWLEKVQNWVMTEGPLQMSIWNGQDWQKVDSLLIGNTKVMQDILVKIDPSLISGNEIKIKLSGLVTAYQIDYAAMDFSEPVPFEKKELSPSFTQKTSQKEISDVLSQLTEIDDQEVSMETGDKIDLEFEEQPYNWRFLGKIISQGYSPLVKRSYFLGAQGWYLTNINNDADLQKNMPTIERLFSLEEGFTARYMLGLEEEKPHHTMYENYVETDISYNQISPTPSPERLPRTGNFLSLLTNKSNNLTSNFWQKIVEFFKNIFHKKI